LWQSDGRGSFESMWLSDDLCTNSTTYEDEKIQYLRQVVRGEIPSRILLTLSSNPYMLFMLTEIYAQYADIPANRGKLFELFVEFLLRDREAVPEEIAQSLINKISILSYNMQLHQTGTGLDRSRILEFLTEQDLYYSLRANLLTGEQTIKFTHQLLQEFFVALYLKTQLANGVSSTTIFPIESWWEQNGWEETVIILAGQFANDCTPVIEWLVETQPEVAARCILESGSHTPHELYSHLQQTWTSRLKQDKGKARATVGRALGILRLDNRYGIYSKDGVPEIHWIEIPTGNFTMGSSREFDSLTAKDELPLREVYIERFFISKYQITVGQYEAFVVSGGYNNRKFWTDSGWEFIKSNNISQPYFWRSPVYHISNHPIVGVCWYEAIAFCNWASEQLGYDITLPTETQWEKASRGTDGRIYPYGSTFEPYFANFEPMGILRTSPVGIYYEGDSPFGVSDCSGNVFEWCLTKYRKSYADEEDNDIMGTEKRVLRGGSWWDQEDLARVACRSKFEPSIKYEDGGFRVVHR